MFESAMELTQEQVQWLNDYTNGTWTLNPQTGLVDVKGSFNCSEQGLTDFKGVRFGVVDGYFYCENNALTSLVGAPLKVGDDFYCDDNSLTSLMGAPQEVGEGFYCHNNALTSLEGAPQEVGGRFYCHDNPVSDKTLKTIFAKMQKDTSYLAAVESLWSEIPLDDQVLLYADDFKWVSPEQSRGIVALRAYQGLRGML